jgi:hypothetical protein
VVDGVHVVGAGLLKESLDVVYQRPHVVFDVVSSGHNALHVGSVRLFVVIIIIIVAGGGSGTLRTLPPPLLVGLALAAMLDDAALLLLGTISLPPRLGRGLAASLLVVY